MRVEAIKTKIFLANDSLFDFVKEQVVLEEGDILVITSKLVALSEGKVGKVEDKEKIIRLKAKWVLKTPWALLTFSQRGWEINAGVDESNTDGRIIYLPDNLWQIAEKLLNELKKFFSLEKLGVIISDTRSLPLRVGTAGRALACAGFLPTKSYVGKEDLFGRESRVTISNVADALASAAVLEMGEGREQTPLAAIKNYSASFLSRPLSEDEKNLNIDYKQDIYSFIYRQKSDKL